MYSKIKDDEETKNAFEQGVNHYWNWVYKTLKISF